MCCRNDLKCCNVFLLHTCLYKIDHFRRDKICQQAVHGPVKSKQKNSSRIDQNIDDKNRLSHRKINTSIQKDCHRFRSIMAMAVGWGCLVGQGGTEMRGKEQD